MFQDAKKRYFGRTVTAVVLGMLLCIQCAPANASTADPIPRILLAGDSWTGFLLAFRSFRTVFPEYNLDRWVEAGNRTAEMGGRVWEMLERNYLQILTEELTRYPNLDVVVITLGGNDIMRGVKGASPTQPDRTVSIKTCFNNDPAYEPWDSREECMEWLAIKLEEQIGVVVDHILSVRPDIRVVILSYDYAARTPPPDAGYTIEEQHLAFLDVEMAKRSLAMARDRVEYVNNFGLMQHLYGIPEENIDPGVAPYPCDAPEDPECTFWPGGYPQYLSPLMAYIDLDIHLTDFGYEAIARRAIDTHILEWLNYPKVLEILPLDNKAPQYQFRVTFSHPVQGVSPGSFEVYVNTKSGLKSMSVVGVEPTVGPADIYTVTVDMDGSSAVAFIRVLDDDSITRPDTGAALGGPGPNNGFFEFNGSYEFVDIPEAADDDFAGAFQFLYMASQAYEHLLSEYGFSFNPEVFDANGPAQFLNIESDPPVIPGNAMPDLYEFMLVDHVLAHSDFDLSATGGAVYATVRSAYTKNINTVQTALGGVGGLADIILPGLDTILAGFVTVGDESSYNIVTALVFALTLIEEFPTNVNPMALMLGAKEQLPQWFAYYGDADGDGWTNEQEYAYFGTDGMAAYVAAATDPAVKPSSGAGRHKTGDFLRIPMMDTPKWTTAYQWLHNGVPLEDNDRINGSASRVLDIWPLELEDAGTYTCLYEDVDGGKGNAVYGPINVTIGESNLPANGVAGLLLVMIASALSGAARLRRKS